MKSARADKNSRGRVQTQTEPTRPREESARRASAGEKVFALIVGVWMGITFVKLGNPVIFDRLVATPQNVAEFIFTSWPVAWGYVLCSVTLLTSLLVLRPKWSNHQWPVLLLALWIFWQFLSATRTVSKTLTAATLPHFVVCCISFLIGWWALARVRLGSLFWTPVLLGFFYTLFSGFDQQNGGLEAMRKAFYEQPDWQTYPKEYLQKMSSNRIFGTFVYPNAFAGGILLLLPVAAYQSWALTERWPRILRGVLVGILVYLGVACLYWSGSKGGWLIGLGLLATAGLHLQFSRKLKIALVSFGLVLGLSFFFVRYSGYFERGATSVGARFTYWSAAVQTIKNRPLFGSGPGTFSIEYGKLKAADAEMAKLAHNDYLEQGSDSGIVGGISFAGFIFLSVALLYRTAKRLGWNGLVVWLGLLGWTMQAFIEFGLYIPALAWPVFLLFGWLWGMKEGDAIKVSN